MWQITETEISMFIKDLQIRGISSLNALWVEVKGQTWPLPPAFVSHDALQQWRAESRRRRWRLRDVEPAWHRDAHMIKDSSRCTCLHVTPHLTSTNTSHVSNPNGSVSPARHVIDERCIHTHTRAQWYLVPSYFAAYVIVPFVQITPLPSTLVTASLSMEQHGTVYISAKLALPFDPTLLHFRHFADCLLRLANREARQQVAKPE